MPQFKAFNELNKDLIVRQRHVRFYTTLILKDLLNDSPVDLVCKFYGLSMGEIQSFQQRCVSTFPLPDPLHSLSLCVS